MRLSVILAAGNRPAWLEKALWGYAVQTDRGFELIVADDNRRPETVQVISRVRRLTGLQPVHLWLPESGRRSCELLDRAVRAASGDYLLFSHAACIPRRDLVEAHLREAQPRRFLAGGWIKLPAVIGERITLEDIRTGRFADPRWLRHQGWQPGLRTLDLLPYGVLPALLDGLSPSRARWNGWNASTWRSALLAANGFEAELDFGAAHRALGERLAALGLRGKQIRHRATCFRLDGSAQIPASVASMRPGELRRQLARMRGVRSTWGIGELPALPFAARPGGVSATRQEG